MVPLSLKKLAPEGVVIRPLDESLEVVTMAVAWNTARMNPLLEIALTLAKAV